MHMPRSPIPVVSQVFAIAHLGLLPSSHMKLSVFPASLRVIRAIPMDHDYTIFGTQ